MDHLSKLFGSPARVKLLRLFTFNPEQVYDRDAVVKFARITPETASRELSALARADIVQRKTFYKEVLRPGSRTAKKRKTIGWILHPRYPHVEALSDFMKRSLKVEERSISKRFRGMGTIRLLVLSGILAGNRDGGLDLLIVGEKLQEQPIKNAVQSLEAECGQEIRYMILSTDEYQYRRRVRDKFIREVMDFPHREVLNKIAGS